jgi:single-stranded-DNA-specific exonuclease
MSLLGKKWVIKNTDEKLNVIAKLLQNRGINSPEKAAAFFEGKLADLHSPALLKDMDKAAERILSAVREKEKIMIFGDYDVDGITATALLYGFLKEVGAEVAYTLPNREHDGYGMKGYFIEQFKKDGIRLIVTVDCGTANLKEVELANQLGIDVVITDHHTMPKQLPPALAIVNPKRPDCPYPNKDICGSSIAFKLVSQLAPGLLGEAEAKTYLDRQLGLVALGVVGDCMPLKGENRILVREGLKNLMAGGHEGITALLAEAGIDLQKINSGVLAYQVSPRINAAGRMDIPNHAFDLLLGKLEKAVTLNELNEKRKAVAKQFVEEAKAQIADPLNPPNIVVVHSPHWNAGLLGLIASELVEKFGRPTIAMQEREHEFVASMRSINDFDITGLLRAKAGPLFTAFGGHTMAGGFSLPKTHFEEFLRHVKDISENHVDPKHFGGILSIDCEIKPEEMTFETVGKMLKLEPFGSENPEPKLLIKNAKILEIRSVGKNAEHLQIPVQYGDKMFRAIAFRFGQHLDKIDPKKLHDLVVHLETNEWNGQRRLQLRIVDLKPSQN